MMLGVIIACVHSANAQKYRIARSVLLRVSSTADAINEATWHICNGSVVTGSKRSGHCHQPCAAIHSARLINASVRSKVFGAAWFGSLRPTVTASVISAAMHSSAQA